MPTCRDNEQKLQKGVQCFVRNSFSRSTRLAKSIPKSQVSSAYDTSVMWLLKQTWTIAKRLVHMERNNIRRTISNKKLDGTDTCWNLKLLYGFSWHVYQLLPSTIMVQNTKKTAPTPKYIFGLNTDLIKVCDLLNKKLIMYHYLLCLQLNFIYKTE